MYAQRGGEKAVFLVPAYVESNFDKKTFDLRDKTVLKFDRDTASRLELAHGDVKSAFVKNGMDWMVAEPFKARADFSVIEGLVSRLAIGADDQPGHGQRDRSQTVRPRRSIGERHRGRRQRAGDAPHRVRGNGTRQVRRLRQGRVTALVFTLPQDLADELKKNIDDLRKKDVFEFRPFNTTRIDITRGAQTMVFEKTKGTGKDAAEKWRRVAPTAGDVDAAKMEAVLTKFSNLRAQSFVDAKTPNGLASPVDHDQGGVRRAAPERTGQLRQSWLRRVCWAARRTRRDETDGHRVR